MSIGGGIPRPHLFQYWHEGPLPKDVRTLRESFMSLNADELHIALHDVTSAHALIQALRGDRAAQAFRQCRVPAMQSDYFRLVALAALGGTYADVDWRCVQPLSGLAALAGQARPARRGVLFRRDNGSVINGLAWMAAPGQALIELALAQATWAIESRLEVGVWLATGPGTFTLTHEIAVHGCIDPRRNWPELYPPAGQPEDAATPACRIWAEALCQRVGTVERAKALFEDLLLCDEAVLSTFVQEPDRPLGYKATPQHWTQWRGSLYAPAGTPEP